MSDERTLGTSHVAAVVVGAIVGVGIFFTPATLARAVPSPAWVLGLWVLGGIASVAGALVFADLGVRWPRAGGLYVFLREGFSGRLGHALSFLYGWLQLLVVQPGAMAVITVVLVDHITYLTGPVTPAVRSGSACAAIVIFTAANLLGLRTSGRIQIGMATLKLAALDPSHLHRYRVGPWSPARHRPGADRTPRRWLVVLASVRDDSRTLHVRRVVPRHLHCRVRQGSRAVSSAGILAGIAAVLVAYLGVNLTYLALLGHDGLAASQSPAADAVGIVLGPAAGKVVAATIVLSAAGILNTVTLGFPFVVYAMARDGVFFSRAGRLDPRTGRPNLAVAVQGALACVAVLVGSSRIDILLAGIAFADATFQAAVAVVHLRGRALARYAHGAAAWTFLAIELGMAIGCLVRAPLQSAYGALVLVTGVVAWLVWRRR